MTHMRLQASISGRVQMVAFRYNTKIIATQLGITGWVRNTQDGRVEVLAEGSQEILSEFLEWLHHGPSHARVDNVKYEFREEPIEFSSFNIKL